MAATRKQVVEESRSWLGVPWAHQRYSKKFGCDCIGLIHGVGVATTAITPDLEDIRKYSSYSRTPDPQLMRKILKTFFIPILLKDAIEGDILWFRIGKYPRHLGIITETGIVIHSDTNLGKVIEHRIATSRLKSVVAAFQFPNIVNV